VEISSVSGFAEYGTSKVDSPIIQYVHLTAVGSNGA
jgi:hypothetical protein